MNETANEIRLGDVSVAWELTEGPRPHVAEAWSW